MPTRIARARWIGSFKSGRGSFAGESAEHKTGRPHHKAVAGNYDFETRFSEKPGPTPEELIAAAEAACYCMALGAALEREGHPASRVDTRVACTMEPLPESGYGITHLRVVVRADAPGCDTEVFLRAAETTKESCPVSKALSGVDIELDAKLS